MATYMRFLYDFMEQFFSGIINIFMGIVRGFGKMFNFKAYLKILKEYSNEFSIGQWILVGVAVLLVFAFLAGIVFLIVMLIRKYLRFRKTLVEQESLLEEVAKLDRDVIRLNQENEELYAVKVPRCVYIHRIKNLQDISKYISFLGGHYMFVISKLLKR